MVHYFMSLGVGVLVTGTLAVFVEKYYRDYIGDKNAK